ncbi:MAG TPA: adenine DNA glycosylase [Gammaproteobacteria bacterium]|nr:adenine DNA glycosylase [Gammaproteobacteria bacterium]
MSPKPFHRRLLHWFRHHGRHDLPWQSPRDAYRVWVSEIMLQQTQVATVIPYFERFMARFPDLASLASADLDQVLHLWTGLGYYARARNLHRAAGVIVAEHGGRFPTDFEAVLALPGIGRSTAGAILAQACDQRHAILDGNVRRVLARHRAIEGWPGQKAVENTLWALAEELTPAEDVADYTQAIMDLGATVCTRSQPRCAACPVSEDCAARAEGRQADFPGRRPRKALPERHTRMLLLRDAEGQVLLEQRPPTGIWGGLWSLPECPPEADLHAWSRETLGVELDAVRDGAPLSHTFTHFRLHIQPVHARLRDTAHAPAAGGGIMEAAARVWYNTRLPADLGLPAPVKSLLADLGAKT